MTTTAEIQLLARAYLNDADIPAGDVYTDEVLLPFVNSAYRDTQRRLVENGVSVMISESDIDLNIGQTILSNGSSPSLPFGFIVPHDLREKATAGGEKFQDMNKHVDGLPDVEQTQFLRMWEWRQNQVNFIGATRAVTVKLRHEIQLLNLTQLGPQTNIVGINGAEEALALRTAAIAVRSRGVRAAAGDLQVEYLSEIKRMVRRNRKPEQRKSRRRKPYGLRNYYWQFRY